MAVPAEGSVEVGPFAVVGDETASGLRLLAGVGDFDERGVLAGPSAGEIEAAFLAPAVPVRFHELVRRCEQRVGRLQ